jgi:hypothetical protein
LSVSPFKDSALIHTGATGDMQLLVT